MGRVQLYQGAQFKYQNVFRTISLGFQPFFPETQKYKMRLDSETFDLTSQEGYWKLGPVKKTSPGDRRKIPWLIRQQSYDAQAPPGKLETLNTYSRKDMALRATSQIDLGLESSKLAGELSELIKAGSDIYKRQWEVSDVGELELTIMGRDIEKVFYDDVISSDPRSTRKSMEEKLKADIPLGGQGLDLYFNEHKGLAEGMKGILGKKGQKHVRKSLGMEVSEAGAGTKRLSMGGTFDNINQIQVDFEAHTEKEIDKLNEVLGKRMRRFNETSTLRNMEDKEAKEIEMMLVRTLREQFAKGTTHTIASFARRLLSRHHEIVGAQLAEGLKVDRFIEQVNLGQGYQGFVVLKGEMAYEKGYDAETDTYTRSQWMPIPQFHILMTKVVAGKSFADLVHTWALNSIVDINRTNLLSTLDTIQQEAIDQGVAIPTRLQWINRVKGAEFDISSIYGLSLAIGKAGAGPGIIGLTTTGIAKGLEMKIRRTLESPEYRNRFAAFYDKMMDASNKLSTQWKRRVPAGQHGAAISTEWTFGDLQGNPHKKYLGIWGPTGRAGAAYDNWKDANRVEGENVSISPWLVSRRAGVASFK